MGHCWAVFLFSLVKQIKIHQHPNASSILFSHKLLYKLLSEFTNMNKIESNLAVILQKYSQICTWPIKYLSSAVLFCFTRLPNWIICWRAVILLWKMSLRFYKRGSVSLSPTLWREQVRPSCGRSLGPWFICLTAGARAGAREAHQTAQGV